MAAAVSGLVRTFDRMQPKVGILVLGGKAMCRLTYFRFMPMVAVFALGALRLSPAAAGPLPDRFTLGKCVPADSWMYVHVVSNPERAWLDARWSDIFAEFKKTGVDQDFIKLFMSMLGDSERAAAQATMDKVLTLVQGVNWLDLTDKEIVFAERPSNFMLGFDYILIAQGKTGTGEANLQGLVAILKESAAATESKLEQSKLHDADVWELSNEGLTKIGLTVSLFRHGDTVGLLTGKKTLEDVVGMLTRKGQGRPIISAPRFQEALKLVETPADSLGYFDWKMFGGSIRTMFQNIEKKANPPKTPGGAPDAEKAQGMQIVMKVLDRFDVFDYSVFSIATKNMREMRWDAVRLQGGKEDTPLARAILNRKAFEKFDQFIPAEATGFDLTGLVDLEALYDMVLDFIAREIPDGPGAVAQWNGILAKAGFDPKADLFTWWSGEMASIKMPPAVVTPLGGDDGVFMIRVKNPELAKTKVNSFVDMVKTRMQAEGQMLMISPAKVDVDGFREITHPSLAMFLRPVIGVHGDWIMAGTSSAAIQKCLDVSTGKAPSILKNARFSEEGLIPKGPVRSATFEDTSKTGQELASALGMMGMFGPMIVGGMPEKTAEEKQTKQAVTSGLSILVKLAPVLQKIDFYSSASSVGTYDGKLTLRTDSVTTYKKAKEGPATAEGHK